MSAFTRAFDALYAAQTRVTGSAALCTDGVDSSVPCVVSDAGIDAAIFGGGIGNTSRMVLQTKLSAWTTVPVVNDSITVSGLPGSNVTRAVISTTDRGGILYITIGDNSIQ